MLQTNVTIGNTRQRLCIFLRQAFNRASTSTVPSAPVNLSDEQPKSDEDIDSRTVAENARIEELRDISRMRSWHRSILHGQPPPIDTYKWQKERWALKERYAVYGRASGVDPGVHWPTSDELEEKRREDEELEPKLLPTMIEMQRLKAEQQKAVEERYVELEQKTKEYPKIMEAHRKKLRTQQEAIEEEKRLKDDKVKEIQSYFGFAIDVSDPRFAAMMAKKELEEKAAKRKRLKREKEEEALRKIEEETIMLKQREQGQLRLNKPEKTEDPPQTKAM